MVTVLALFCSMLVTPGCSTGKKVPPPPPPSDAGQQGTDAGPGHDGGPVADGGAPRDGALLDAMTTADGALPDGAVGDGGAGDGGAGCEMAPSGHIRLGTDAVGHATRVVAIAPHANGFTVAWAAAGVGIDQIWTREVPSSGTAPDAVQVTTSAISRSPSLASLGTSTLLSFYDNSAGNYEVQVVPLDASASPVGSPMRLTMNTLRDDQPALVTLGTGFLAAWVEDDMVAGTRTAKTHLLSSGGAPSGSVQTVSSPGQSPTTPILSPLMGGPGVAWAEVGSSGTDVILQRLDMSGATTGGPITLSTEHNADGAVDMATDEGGGAVVFGTLVGGVRPEVRFRPIDGTGMPTGPERILTMAPEQGRDPSIAMFAGGYVVSYRAIADTGLSQPEIRLAFVDRLGNVVTRTSVTNCVALGGRTTVRVAGDGTILVGWNDQSGPTEGSLTVVRLVCGG